MCKDKKNLTFETYCNLCDELANMEQQPNGYYPSLEEIEKYIIPSPKKYINFLIWITELNSSENLSKKDKESRKKCLEILNNYLTIK